MNLLKKILVPMLVVLVLFAGLTSSPLNAKPTFKVAWSIYVGWMPWDYANYSGILKKWADAYGINIELVRMDYVPSIEAYVANKVDACVMTNMECLDMPATSGIDSTVIIIGDYSNGNDALLVRDNLTVKGLKNKEVILAELTVSHYMLARCLEMNGMKEEDVKVVNVSDSEIGPVFISQTSLKAVVTWNPIVMQIAQTPGVTKLFSSAQIPAEILDLMVVNTNTLKKNPDLGKALTGAWYEVMGIMNQKGEVADKAMTVMAKASGCSLTEFKSQLKTTAMYYDPTYAVKFVTGPDIKSKMEFVRQFCFKHGLLGENASSVNVVGIQYPDGSVQGDANKITFRFVDTYMKMAMAGTLKK